MNKRNEFYTAIRTAEDLLGSAKRQATTPREKMNDLIGAAMHAGYAVRISANADKGWYKHARLIEKEIRKETYKVVKGC